MMGPYYGLLRTCYRRLVAEGVDSETASTFTASLLYSMAVDEKGAGESGFDGLVVEQSPGGITSKH